MKQAGQKMAGRPRSIDLESLLETAAEMDLSTISMKELADQLGVGVATVYRYVKDRESLVRLASARAAHRALPVDRGQGWQELAHAYADSMFSALSGNPGLLHTYIDGDLGGELEVEFVDHFLAAMTRRGFAAEQALALFRMLGLIAMGTAAATVHMRTHAARHGGFAQSVDTALANRDEGELPHLRAVQARYIDLLGTPDLRSAIDAAIAGIPAPKGEPSCRTENNDR